MNKLLKFVLGAILISGLLSACGNSEEVVASTRSVPIFCEDTEILEAFPEKVPNPKYIPTDWEPSPGTDLYAAYQAGGIACSYGIGEAEVGATIIWAPNDTGVFEERAELWTSSGLTSVDLPGLEEERALVLTQGTQGEQEFIVWQVNLLKDGYWIQVGATFFGSIEETVPLAKAALDSILSEDDAASLNIAGCYVARLGSDVYVMDLDSHRNTTVSGALSYRPFEKDKSEGSFKGTYENGILRGIYSFSAEGSDSERELFFKREGSDFLVGIGPVEIINNRFERLQRPLQLKWDPSYRYSPSDECSELTKEDQ